jgi:hypothetical protein
VGGLAAYQVMAPRPFEPDARLSEEDEPSDREIDSRQQVLLKRSFAKLTVARATIRGEIELAEAVRRFRVLSRHDASSLTILRNAFPLASEDELWRLQVLSYIRGQLAFEPARNPIVAAKLQAEIAASFPSGQQSREGHAASRGLKAVPVPPSATGLRNQ